MLKSVFERTIPKVIIFSKNWRLEEISMSNSIKRKLEEEEENEETDNSDKIKIHEENVSLGNLDVFNINELSKTDNIPLLSLDVEELF